MPAWGGRARLLLLLLSLVLAVQPFVVLLSICSGSWQPAPPEALSRVGGVTLEAGAPQAGWWALQRWGIRRRITAAAQAPLSRSFLGIANPGFEVPTDGPGWPHLSRSTKARVELGAGRFQSLLATQVDAAVSVQLLTTRAAYTCGGRPALKLSSAADLTGGSIRGAVPASDELAATRLGSCAVVGSSRSLRGSSLGAAIDAHDAVIRLGAAPTRGFAHDVGERTTLRLQLSDAFNFSEPHDERRVLVLRSREDAACYAALARESDRRVLALSPEFWCHAWDWVAQRRSRPSVGLAGVVLALRQCDPPVNLYGFSFDTGASYCYYDDAAGNSTAPNVLPLREEAFVYRQLQALGRVTLH